ncbi:MAG TPA: sigma-70 family RNA polymerase sigma factor [Myxococcales bacterium]|nr:sigma-70 family RNA polymerase sigma factor [Myxococcales bacterium]
MSAPNLDFRRESARMTAALTRVLGFGNLALAEDVVQDVLVRALEAWAISGPPRDASAWLIAAARNRAIDLIRRERTRLRFAPDPAGEGESTITAAFTESEIADELLRMMFSVCSPVLPEPAQLALVLKLLCGFGTREIAAALLSSEAAVEKLLNRGKEALARSGTLFEVAGREQLRKRLGAVEHALYLLFSEGYHGSGEPVQEELCAEAMRLCGLLAQHPACATPRTLALLAMMCFHAARLPARRAPDGALLLLEQQDRSRWDRALIARGFALLDRSAEGDELSEYHLEAAIASVHCAADSVAGTDWARIVDLYDLLYGLRPSPVVALNRAIAIGEARGAEAGLAALGPLADEAKLSVSPFLAGALGRFQQQAGRTAEAERAFGEAAGKARNPAEAKLFRELQSQSRKK